MLVLRVVALLFLLASCGKSPPPYSAATSRPSRPAAPTLVGRWRVSDISDPATLADPDVTRRQILTIAPDSKCHLYTPLRRRDGTWTFNAATNTLTLEYEAFFGPLAGTIQYHLVDGKLHYAENDAQIELTRDPGDPQQPIPTTVARILETAGDQPAFENKFMDRVIECDAFLGDVDDQSTRMEYIALYDSLDLAAAASTAPAGTGSAAALWAETAQFGVRTRIDRGAKVRAVCRVTWFPGLGNALQLLQISPLAPAPVPALTAAAFARQCRVDPAAAQTQYAFAQGGRTILLTGTVKETSAASILLGDPPDQVRCIIRNSGSDSVARRLRAIKPGDSLRLVGYFKSASPPTLHECSIFSSPASTSPAP